MEKNILNEIETMKYLLRYKKGVVISEQSSTSNAVDSDNDINPNLTQTTTQQPVQQQDSTQTTIQQPAQQQVSTQINVGVKNPSIEELQNNLNSKFQSGLVPDGKYGPKTAASILSALQKIITPTETKNTENVAQASDAAQKTAQVNSNQNSQQTIPQTIKSPDNTQTQNKEQSGGSSFSETDLNNIIA